MVSGSTIGLLLEFKEDDPYDLVKSLVPEPMTGLSSDGVMIKTISVQDDGGIELNKVLTYDVTIENSGDADANRTSLDENSMFNINVVPNVAPGVCGAFVDIDIQVKAGVAKDHNGNLNTESQIVHRR